MSDKTTAELKITNMVGVFIVLAAFTILAITVEIGDKIMTKKKEKKVSFKFKECGLKE